MLFTFENYRLLLETLLRRGLQNLTIADYLETRPTDDFFILRHDVEWNPDKALDVARLEISLGLRASYYFHRPNRQRVFNTRVMAELQKMGHEIGYQYETVVAGAAADAAIALMRCQTRIAPARLACRRPRDLASGASTVVTRKKNDLCTPSSRLMSHMARPVGGYVSMSWRRTRYRWLPSRLRALIRPKNVSTEMAA